MKNIYQYLGISDLVEKESDMEEMEHPQTKLSRVARWAENENMEVFCSFLSCNLKILIFRNTSFITVNIKDLYCVLYSPSMSQYLFPKLHYILSNSHIWIAA
jgi:hypothetical protein